MSSAGDDMAAENARKAAERQAKLHKMHEDLTSEQEKKEKYERMQRKARKFGVESGRKTKLGKAAEAGIPIEGTAPPSKPPTPPTPPGAPPPPPPGTPPPPPPAKKRYPLVVWQPPTPPAVQTPPPPKGGPSITTPQTPSQGPFEGSGGRSVRYPPPPPPRSRKPPLDNRDRATRAFDKLREWKEAFDAALDNPELLYARGERRQKLGERQQKGGFGKRLRGAAEKAGARTIQSAQLAGVGEEFRSGAAAVGAAGGMASAIPVVGRAVEAFTKLAKVVLDNVDRFQKWNHSLEEANFRFAQFSGAMSRVLAEHIVRQVTIEQERGERRAGSADFQAKQTDKLEREMSKWGDLFARGWNYISGAGAGVLGEGMKWFDENVLPDWAKKLLEGNQEPEDPNAITLPEWIKEVGEEQWPEKHNRPRRFG